MQKTLMASAVLLASVAALSPAQSAEFSAVAVDVMPGRGMKTSAMYVSKSAVRHEYRHRGMAIVRIVMPKTGVVRYLFPRDKTYVEYNVRNAAALAGIKPDKPCEPNAYAACELLSKEQFNGIDAERWRIAPKGRPGSTTLWWDGKRKMPLRIEYRDGRTMQAIKRGTRMFDNQKVEEWEFVYMSPFGRFLRTMALYSPELGVTVAEIRSSGRQKRLHSVTIGAPDAKLFEVPAGYRRLASSSFRGRRLPPAANGAPMAPPKVRPQFEPGQKPAPLPHNTETRQHMPNKPPQPYGLRRTRDTGVREL